MQAVGEYLYRSFLLRRERAPLLVWKRVKNYGIVVAWLLLPDFLFRGVTSVSSSGRSSRCFFGGCHMGIGFPHVRFRFRCYYHMVAGGLPCHPARYTPSPSHTKSGFHLLRYMAKQEALSSVIAFEALPVAKASQPFMYNNSGLGKPFLLLQPLCFCKQSDLQIWKWYIKL